MPTIDNSLREIVDNLYGQGVLNANDSNNPSRLLPDDAKKRAYKKLLDLLEQERREARIDELIRFMAKLDEQDPYTPLDGTPRDYVHSKFNERLSTLKSTTRKEA